MELQNQTVLVTGAGSGIGRALALEFARNGARVVVAGRRTQRLEETVSLIRSSPRERRAPPRTSPAQRSAFSPSPVPSTAAGITRLQPIFRSGHPARRNLSANPEMNFLLATPD
ncbi:MAG: SDR family NAD(P)-dependent oxidoreductase [Verrucomicrobiae bacterium]|nr:SDR family NAD(P)-dependent oxidoreductase [Verrucomicrobiae bacterium]